MHWIVLLIALPMLTGAATLPLVQRLVACRVLGVIGLTSTLVASLFLLARADREGGLLVSQMGGWAAPYGISLVLDTFSGMLLVGAAFVMLCGMVASFTGLERRIERRYFHPLFHFMHAGVNLSFLTGDLFNLFVAFEIMLMASYGLMCAAAESRRLAQAYKYVLVNLVASALFVLAAGLVYAMFGTLNVADLMTHVQATLASGEALPTGFAAVAAMLAVVFGLKAAVFPMWFWLPDAYPTLPTPLLAVFGGVLTKVGVYAFARLFPPIFLNGDDAAFLDWLLAAFVAVTLLLAGWIAVAYRRLRHGVCMLVIAGVGVSLAGVLIGSDDGFAGVAYYSVQSMLACALAFMICGRIEAVTGTDALDAPATGALFRESPWLAAAALFAFLTLVGLPPLSGFYGKLLIVQAGLTGTSGGLGVVLALAVLLGSGLVLLAVLRWWTEVFWLPSEPLDDQQEAQRGGSGRRAGLDAEGVAVGLLLAGSLLLGLTPQPGLHLAKDAGARLNDPVARYAQAVLNPRPGTGAALDSRGSTEALPAQVEAERPGERLAPTATPPEPDHSAEVH